MTYTSKELAALQVDTRVLAFRRWRRARKISQGDCERLIGLGRGSITRIEVGRGRPRNLTLVVLERLMGEWHEGLRFPKRKRGRRVGWKRAQPVAAVEARQ